MENDEKHSKRIADAQKRLKAIQERIAPFIRRRVLQQRSTRGEWQETSSLGAAEKPLK